ncbi:MAG TPA: FAD:protein FMN transferase, partial [Gaiellales bacterium]|nr:FAD:protein FMN transferase [Gaiellales bacterium]
MGCEVCVEGAAAPVASGIRSLFEDWEQTFSRFRADSELTAVNSRAGRPTVVSSRFATAVRAAIRMAAATGGLVVPTLAEALDAAGYDRDLD